MFEDATFDSRPHLPGKTPQRFFLALTVNLTILTALIVYPLLYPENLSTRLLRNILYAPPVPPAPSLPRSASTAPAATQTVSLRNPFEAPRQIPNHISTDPGPAPESLDPNTFTTLTSAVGSSTSTSVFQQPAPHVAPKPVVPKSVTVSQGVAIGLLLFHPAPVYPAIAKAAHTSGTVVLAATIDHQGKIANLRVVSGPPLLREAALTAVQQWRYRPYFLNNQPVDVETTINVVFSLGN
jgi:protein TonB